MDQRPATCDQRMVGRSDALTRRESMRRASFAGRWSLVASQIVFALLTLTPAFAAEPISTAEITALKEDLATAAKQDSHVEIRRACKGVIRKVNSLLEASPDAPNRYAVLEILFNSQKRLLTLEATESNRAAIYETCEKFIEAPDEFAETRFDADMMLSERDLAAADATVAERLNALQGILEKYRGTDAEWKSLMVGSLIATKLLGFDLEAKINATMAERFGGDHKVIEFRRKKDMGGQIDAVFSGKYKANDGRELVFPNDRIGNQYVLYFWSQGTPEIDQHLKAMKEWQGQQTKSFEVFSFNLDELPDAGEKRLRQLGLKWPAMHLPGGRNSSAYRAYSMFDPHAIFVNGQAHAYLKPPPRAVAFDWHGHPVQRGEKVFGAPNLGDIALTLDDERYLAQLRYLFNGDFLVGSLAAQGKRTSVAAPLHGASSNVAYNATATAFEETLQAIEDCFVPVPFRYRLKLDEELANYRKAEKLCGEMLRQAQHGKGERSVSGTNKSSRAEARDLIDVRNCRIIALIGMWNLATEPKYLAEAVKEANAVLAMDLPAGKPGVVQKALVPGSDVVARFCLAKNALRSGADPEAVLADLVGHAGGDRAPVSVQAAAAAIALEANARTAYNKYRQRLLEVKGEDVDPALWSFYAFLRDLHHQRRNFWASPSGYGFARPQKYKTRDEVAGLDKPGDRNRRVEFTLEKPGGGQISIPRMATGKILGVVFTEPPPDCTVSSHVARLTLEFAGGLAKYGAEVVVAAVSDDTNAVAALADVVGDRFKIGALPGGLAHPLARQLGILSPDMIPNVLLYRPDGTVAWMISGLNYRTFHSITYAIGRAIASNTAKIRSDVGFELLEKGEFKNALAAFKKHTVKRVEYGDDDWWASDRSHGKALAYMGLKNWNAALPEIDVAIERRKSDFKSGMCKCHGVVEMMLTKATILDKLGRGREASDVRSRASREGLPHAKLPPGNARTGVPVGVYYDQLKRIRLAIEGE